jgi:hypothetical protein
MGKDNKKVTDCKVPIPYIPEDEKEYDPSDGKPPSVKLLLDSECKKIDNPKVNIQPIFNRLHNVFQVVPDPKLPT